jgi:prepilin-type N-terminal cleavage/methylation domain-containing protein
MRPTSRTRPESSSRRLRARAGYSVLEVLVVLAIMALAVALVMPRGALMIDRMTAHAVFFDFPARVLDLRRQAYADQAPIVLYDDPAAPGAILAGGCWPCAPSGPTAWPSRCGSAKAGPAGTTRRDPEGGPSVMRLAPRAGECRFIRLD